MRIDREMDRVLRSEMIEFCKKEGVSLLKLQLMSDNALATTYSFVKATCGFVKRRVN